MEIREYAERVLFATSLDEKLRLEPIQFTDSKPGPALNRSPDSPGRLESLRMSREGERGEFPRPAELENEEGRGRLLHYMANHELLAAELMALVLLKFPQAPESFRLGVARTLREEQMHTRLYLQRMSACGVEFGSRPVNGFFWKYVAPMENPADYVARLSLTFEQANLDYAQHFSSVFHALGDDATARLLERIYRDEIGHVSYGLRWFRRWKPVGASDWDAFQDQLPFPLSPSRAKAHLHFNREGRRLAGLDTDFIDRLSVYEQSRGRTPELFLFNPGVEHEVANASPPRSLRVLQRDLSSIPLFLAKRDDIVLMEEIPSLAFLESLREAGWALPEIRLRSADPPDERKIYSVCPWGWSPAIRDETAGWRARATSQTAVWEDSWRELYSKAFGVRMHASLIEQIGPEGRLTPAELGQLCRDESEVGKAIDLIRELGHSRMVVKGVYGVAGQDMALWTPERAEQFWSLCKRLMERDGRVVVEPWFERLMDFSVHYEVGEHSIQHLGFTRLHNDGRGRFRACSVERCLAANGDETLRRFVHGAPGNVLRLYREEIPDLLWSQLAERGFRGPLSLDAMIIRRFDGSPAHCPIVEINPRYTMGRVTHELATRWAAKDRRAVFEILTQSDLARTGCATFAQWADRQRVRNPVEVIPGKRPPNKLRQGFVCLNDPQTAAAFLAALRVGNMEWHRH